MSPWPSSLPEFLWGVATSAHQVEGHQPGNDWTDWEAAGRTREPSGAAVDEWHRYPEDLALFAGLNANAYRFSLEWSRLEPEPHRFADEAFAHYRALMEAARSLGLEPLVTLSHFTLPRWLAREGGWLAPGAVGHFTRFAAEVSARFPEVRLWCTINEPSILAVMGYMDGVWPPGHRRPREARVVLDRQLAAHEAVYPLFKRVRPDALVGLAHHLIHFRPWRPQVLDRALAAGLDRLFNERPLRRLLATQDYLGVNYYSCRWADWTRPLNPRVARPDAALTDSGWEEDPEGLAFLLTRLRRWQRPILVTENGIATDDEERRGRFLRRHVAAVAAARAAGADVRGYFYWSGIDNFEWVEGYRPHFGLYGVGSDGTRVKKGGATVFQQLARQGPPRVSAP